MPSAEDHVEDANGQGAVKLTANDVTFESVTRTVGTDLDGPSTSRNTKGLASASYRSGTRSSATVDGDTRQATDVAVAQLRIEVLERSVRRSPSLSESASNRISRRRADESRSQCASQKIRRSVDSTPVRDIPVQREHEFSHDTDEITHAVNLDTPRMRRSTDGDASSKQPSLVGLRNRARQLFRSLADVLRSNSVVRNWPSLPACSFLPVRDIRARLSRRRTQAPDRSTPNSHQMAG